MNRLTAAILITATTTIATVSAPVPAAAQAAPAERTADAAPAVVGAYPGDVIRVTIWREPDLSRELTVPPGGVVIFPKIGARTVTGRPITEVEAELLADYGQYLINPSIQIELLRKVQVLGAVYRPGVYTVDATVSVRDAVAIAGGVTPAGRQDRVELRRDGDVVQVVFVERATLADTPIRSGDQLFVPERPYLARNGGAVAAVLSGGIGLIVALLVR
jgi:polysaccharide biosynthesis/export protein